MTQTDHPAGAAAHAAGRRAAAGGWSAESRALSLRAVGYVLIGLPLGLVGLGYVALLTYVGALGDVTELLSGDFATPFGRSSHHQIWSEAMVIAPVVRGLLGIETTDAGGALRLAPTLPANWDHLELRGVSAGLVRYDVSFERSPGRMLIRFARREAGAPAAGAPKRLVVAPALPLDSRVQRVTVNGTVVKHEVGMVGDVQRVQILTDDRPSSTEVVFSYDEGTDAYVEPQDLQQGAVNNGLRILRARASATALRLTIEGIGGRTYLVGVRTPRRLGTVEGVVVTAPPGRDPQLRIRIEGPAEQYVRREIAVPLLPR